MRSTTSRRPAHRPPGSIGAQLDSILEDTGTTLPATLNALPAAIEQYLATYHGAGIWDGSTALVNTYARTYYLPDSTGHPIADCLVWVTTDIDGTNIVQKAITDDFGNVTVYLQVGTYYVWRRKAGRGLLESRYNYSGGAMTTITGSAGTPMGFGGPFGSTRRVLREEVGRVFGMHEGTADANAVRRPPWSMRPWRASPMTTGSAASATSRAPRAATRPPRRPANRAGSRTS